MTPEQIEKYRKAAEEGTLPDDMNPLYLFSTTRSDLLIKFLNREFSFTAVAKQTLRERGLSTSGKWIGFKDTAKRKTGRKRGKSMLPYLR